MRDGASPGWESFQQKTIPDHKVRTEARENLHAGMAELVYALVLGTSGATLGSSSLPPGTKYMGYIFARLESRRQTYRDGVAGFFSRKIPVTEFPSRHP